MARRKFIACTPVELPDDQHTSAAQAAIRINPLNAPATELQRIGVLSTKYWGARGVDLTVSFMESCPGDLANRILSHMNAWGDWANVCFRLVSSGGQIRVTRAGNGYWSYLGTDCLQIPRSQPTMCLSRFSMSTPESEYRRVIRHETGHALGFPHEHMRQSIIDLLDARRTIEYFGRTQGWSPEQVRQQILTPVQEVELLEPTAPDVISIMTYSFPGECTKNGEPIPGGPNINAVDGEYAGRIYPMQTPVAPPVAGAVSTLIGLDASGKEVGRWKVSRLS